LDTGKESPPDFGRLPPRATFRKIPYEISYSLSQNQEINLPLEKNFSLPIYANTENLFLPICKVFSVWEYCRSRIYGISFPLSKLDQTYWPDLIPLFSACSIVESPTNTTSLYLVDSPTIRITKDESVVKLAGLFYPQNNIFGNCYDLGYNVNADCGQSDLNLQEGELLAFDDLVNWKSSTLDDEGFYSRYGPRIYDNKTNFLTSLVDNLDSLGQNIPELIICPPQVPVSGLNVIYNENTIFSGFN
jgi:hypothetical protein